MNSKVSDIIVHIVSLLVACFGAILAIGDKITDIPGLDPHLVNAWPTLFFAATLIDRIGTIIIKMLTPKVVILVIFCCILLPGCSNVQSLGVGVGLSKNDGRINGGNIQGTIVFRDARDAKTIRKPVVQ